MRRTIADPETMHAFGLEMAGLLRAGDLMVLTGPLGAGKTTFTRGLGEGLRVRGAVTSPTFVLARTHPSTIGGPPLVHVDAYRLSSAMELDDLDIDFARSIVVVEWGRGLLEGITESWLDMEIERPLGASQADPDADIDDAVALDLPEPRTVTVTGHGPRWQDGLGFRSDPAGPDEPVHA
ncbi:MULTISPECIES: tRNA (adenosine(37)-N6)-threonylcarbamoyltransferase complex ATPase subunit type 1 TsaE [Cryobacterium]|uniref:tRNA threonylcarbamoyladenosine biosynthesis protein TsaE n=1 Tax=Cryobacterium zongtaii TaxID=1259217 RepID=A0A2S3ZMM1_9MICO|nr:MULTISPECIES: tRNA (adenosine(37)-N6)-threonylcarbamoyltransferase complex ATPase subunit type 1 TsaE [Cryobacterium]POH68548.1 tRNA (adenosine(37)-N6)-threonylcarbamoyltransferase complex ATPase subunit type 1 TsaE [Cryobacterium zongtaii]POH70165.1 tRNA (adenosine(37)-N6)-threonylcarbamoyltransferase complex ATPase subunit type 1 TsaE [Cryobacterium zongtaii]TFC49233.1 tRNA (adenosine(37)-N6)-threonylcarbamoyltransferase complex ATPase subunit type 1 TsaE [Cryobacterium sp. TMN-39-2]